MYIKISELIYQMYPGSFIDLDTGTYHELIDERTREILLDQEYKGSNRKWKILELKQLECQTLPDSFLPVPLLDDEEMLLQFLDSSQTLNKYSNNRAINNFVAAYRNQPDASSFLHDLQEAGLDRFGNDDAYVSLTTIREEYVSFQVTYKRGIAIAWCQENNINYTEKP